MVVLLLLLTGLIYALQYRPVQTFFAKRAAVYLSGELRTTVSLEGLYFKPFSSLVLSGLYVADLAGDTLLYADELTASVDLWKIRDGRITINELALTGGSFLFHRQGDSSNLSFIVDYFSPETRKSASGGRRQITLDIDALNLSDITLRYLHGERGPATKGINYRDINVTQLSGRFRDIDLNGPLFKSTIEDLSFREKSGLIVREMRALAEIDTNYLELQDLYLATNRSHVGDYLRFEYANFAAFGDFMDAVTIE
ncbi:MAG TPA: hypothetical protein VNQ55_11015, partial [Parapedobacter sp.]|nr:hypothetical protein [Parapedobacter sp.]